MRKLFDLTLTTAAVLLTAVSTSGVRAGPADTTARSLVADWKNGGGEMAAVAEVIASAFASGMSWAGTIEALLPAAGRGVHWQPGHEHPR